MMINWKGFGRKRSWSNGALPRNYMEKLRTTTKTPNQGSQCPGREPKRTPPQKKIRAVPLHKTAQNFSLQKNRR